MNPSSMYPRRQELGIAEHTISIKENSSQQGFWMHK